MASPWSDAGGASKTSKSDPSCSGEAANGAGGDGPVPGGCRCGTAQVNHLPLPVTQSPDHWCARLLRCANERVPGEVARMCDGSAWGRRAAMHWRRCSGRSQQGVGGMPVSLARPSPPMCRLSARIEHMFLLVKGDCAAWRDARIGTRSGTPNRGCRSGRGGMSCRRKRWRSGRARTHRSRNGMPGC